jgi:ParB family chromosome partitioning protein
MNGRRKGLGRGLDALLGVQQHTSSKIQSHADTNITGRDELQNLPVEFLCPGKYQPRRDMVPAALEELADSIRQQGILQPISVRRLEQDSYEIIAGERRWRAAQLAGLATIPVLIKDVSDQAAIAMALIENIQREDLNAMEEARALTRLQEEFGLTQQEVATAVGKPRATVANLMRLIHLEPEVRTLLECGDLEMGHGKALLGLNGHPQIETARLVCSRGMTVRQTEELVRQKHKSAHQSLPRQSQCAHPDVGRLEDDLSARVGAMVQIKHAPSGRGRLIVRYSSLDELEGILSHIR